MNFTDFLTFLNMTNMMYCHSPGCSISRHSLLFTDHSVASSMISCPGCSTREVIRVNRIENMITSRQEEKTYDNHENTKKNGS